MRVRPAGAGCRRAVLTVAVGVMLAAVGCGPQPEATAPTVADSADAPSPGTVPPTAAEAPSRNADRDRAGSTARVSIPLPPIGPAAPDSPAPFRWYHALQSLDCNGLADTSTNTTVPRDQRELFGALAQVCGALASGTGAVDWLAAAAAVRATAGESDCMVAAARQMLAAAVAAHEQQPGAVLTAGQPAAGTACPVAVANVEMAAPDTINLAGPYLFGATAVLVGGTSLEPQTDREVEPPQAGYVASGDICLPAGVPSRVDVVGPGYRVGTTFVPRDVGQGDCGVADTPTETESPAP